MAWMRSVVPAGRGVHLEERAPRSTWEHTSWRAQSPCPFPRSSLDAWVLPAPWLRTHSQRGASCSSQHISRPHPCSLRGQTKTNGHEVNFNPVRMAESHHQLARPKPMSERASRGGREGKSPGPHSCPWEPSPLKRYCQWPVHQEDSRDITKPQTKLLSCDTQHMMATTWAGLSKTQVTHLLVWWALKSKAELHLGRFQSITISQKCFF